MLKKRYVAMQRARLTRLMTSTEGPEETTSKLKILTSRFTLRTLLNYQKMVFNACQTEFHRMGQPISPFVIAKNQVK